MYFPWKLPRVGKGNHESRTSDHGVLGRPRGGGSIGGCTRRSDGPLRNGPWRSTLYDMRNALTIRLDSDLEKLLDRLCKQTGRTRSQLVRDALRRQLRLLQFEQLRGQTMPFAEARGYLTDEDIVRDVS